MCDPCRDLARSIVERLEGMGVGNEEADVSGADAVDYLNELLADARKAVTL